MAVAAPAGGTVTAGDAVALGICPAGATGSSLSQPDATSVAAATANTGRSSTERGSLMGR